MALGLRSRSKILVAIDFGTTFSGVAWAQTARPEIQTMITQWPDDSGSFEGITNDKVPTEIAYGGSDCKWGFQIPDGHQRYQWFKLELDPNKVKKSSHLTVEYPDPNALPTNFIRTAEALSIDYLTHLREHIVKGLKTKVGECVITSTTIEYIITVPAMWSDVAKFKTRACAKRAGMGDDLQIISEPEAAVIYALHAMDPETLKVGDKFVLCDAGGGTVDLISYTIDELKPAVEIREAAPGSGAACGSTFLNRIFRRYLEMNFSDNPGWDDETLEAALDRFETIAKRKFNGDQKDIIIPVPGLTNDRLKCIMRGKLTMSASTLRSIFEPIVTTITALVMAQVRATGNVQAVLLVGGFGQSPYLRECIRKVAGPSIQVIQPAKGWTAVVRGALIKALAQASPAPADASELSDESLTQEKRRVTGRLADGTPATTRSVRYVDIKEFRTLKECWDSGSEIPDDLEFLVSIVNHRMGHDLKPAYKEKVDGLRLRRYEQMEGRLADLTHDLKELDDEVMELMEERDRLRHELAEARSAPVMAMAPIDRPVDVVRRPAPVPVAAIGVAVIFDALLDAGVDAVVSGNRDKMEDWVKAVCIRDKPLCK